MFRRIGIALSLLIAGVSLADAPRYQENTAIFVNTYLPGNLIAGFGGLSGLEVSSDGTAFFALSDRSLLFEGRFSRTDGVITDALVRTPWQLRDGEGQIFRGKSGDSEGLALSDDGDLLISFEGIPRLSLVPEKQPDQINLHRFPRPNAFRRMPENAALEALAVDHSGTYYTLPEDTRDGSNFPVWRFRGNSWDQPFHITRRGDFLPVGADFGPDGMFYLLERRLGFPGFASRIRRFTITGDQISAGETILETWPGQHDNLEGIAIWQDHHGRIRITMVSDSNYFILQRTEFVEYMIP